MPGTRDEKALEAALAGPRHQWSYDDVRDLTQLGAAYCYGLARGHPYVDGNKRIAFLGMAAILEMNGLTLTAADDEVVRVIRGVAAGTITEAALADWISANVVGSPILGR